MSANRIYKGPFIKCPRCNYDWSNKIYDFETFKTSVLRCECESVYFNYIDVFQVVLQKEPRITVEWDIKNNTSLISYGGSYAALNLPFFEYNITLDKINKYMVFL